MDTDSLPSATIFVAFLLLFSYLSLAHHSSVFPVNSVTARKTPHWVVSSLAWLKYACVIAVALSGLALVHSTGTVIWWPASLLSLALLIFLVAIDRLAGAAASRLPTWAVPWQRALLRAASGSPATGSNGVSRDNGEGTGASTGDALLERPQPAITEAELVSMDHRDREMLRSILRLDVTTAREIMVPRLDMVVVEADSTLAEVSEKMVQGDIVGYPSMKRLLTAFLASSMPETCWRHWPVEIRRRPSVTWYAPRS